MRHRLCAGYGLGAPRRALAHTAQQPRTPVGRALLRGTMREGPPTATAAIRRRECTITARAGA